MHRPSIFASILFPLLLWSSIPISGRQKITDEFSINFTAELFVTTNELNRTAGGIDISIGGSIYL
jgi:hypothetical protein